MFSFLTATDCHLGYSEKDGVRHSDSLVTFEEILQHAKKQKVCGRKSMVVSVG